MCLNIAENLKRDTGHKIEAISYSDRGDRVSHSGNCIRVIFGQNELFFQNPKYCHALEISYISKKALAK